MNRDAAARRPWSLLDLDRAFRACWAADTCSPDDLPDWRPDNPSVGHCDITTLVVNDLTLEQFQAGEALSPPRTVTRPPGPLPRRHPEYELLRARLTEHLGPLPSAGGVQSPRGDGGRGELP
ncbi:YunG family protein [Streptomyces althioticus]|uniref:YunG family protein n=1 Tax=Streptomyces althioticus TaxID=83380 RepID=UPI00339F099C